jgi:hypothetical protein
MYTALFSNFCDEKEKGGIEKNAEKSRRLNPTQ